MNKGCQHHTGNKIPFENFYHFYNDHKEIQLLVVWDAEGKRKNRDFWGVSQRTCRKLSNMAVSHSARTTAGNRKPNVYVK